MKRFVLILCTMFCCVAAIAQTISIDWKIGNDIYSQSTCEYGGDLNVPTAPTKYGYTFQGWANYTPIEYLESTGTQRIDTGVTASAGTNSVKLLIDYFPTTTEGYMGWNGCTQLRMSNLVSGRRQTAYSLCTNDGITINVVDGIQKERSPFGFGGGNLHLFALGASGFTTKGRLYSAQIYVDDILVRDFIPVLGKDDVPYLYDKVEGKFYYNKGTGNFIAGPGSFNNE